MGLTHATKHEVVGAHWLRDSIAVSIPTSFDPARTPAASAIAHHADLYTQIDPSFCSSARELGRVFDKR